MDRYKWIISLVPVVLSILMIRQYLGFFDNATLFTENLSVINGFSFVFIFATLISAILLLIFYLPSIILLTIPRKAPGILYYGKIKGKIALLSLVIMPLSIYILFTWSYVAAKKPDYESLAGWFAIAAFFLMLIAFSHLSFRRDIIILRRYQKKNLFLTLNLIRFGVPALLLIVIMAFSYAELTILGWVNSNSAGDSLEMLLKVATLTALIAVSVIIPGIIYVVAGHSETTYSWIKVTAFSSLIFLSLLSPHITPLFPQVIHRTMKLAGISDWKTRRFQIDESIISYTHFHNPVWETSEVISGMKNYSVKGILVYSFNNIKLLCPVSIREPYEDMLKFIPFDKNYDKQTVEKLHKASAFCQPFTQGGITRLNNTK